MYEGVKKACLEYYERAVAEYGDNPRGVNWRDASSQRIRFAILCEIGDLRRKRVHDVGCGLGHMADYLTDHGINCDYVGSDISATMIDHARRRVRLGAQFYLADILDTRTHEWMRADYVLTSGLFHVKSYVDREEWREFVKVMIVRMFELASSGIGFNMMTSYVDYEDSHLFYQSPAETLDFCIRNLSRRVAIRHDYPLWEYTIYVYK